MRAFATIATFAAIAFSAVVSAAPTPQDVVASSLAGPESVDPNKLPELLDHSKGSSDLLSRREEGPSLLDILGSAGFGALGTSAGGEGEVQARGDPTYDSSQAAGILKGIIEEVHVKITASISAGCSNVLTVNGAAVSVQVAAKIVVDFILKITAIVSVIMKNCGSDDKTAVLGVVADIYSTISVIVTAVLGVYVNIQAEVFALVQVNISYILGIVGDLDLGSFLSCFDL